MASLAMPRETAAMISGAMAKKEGLRIPGGCSLFRARKEGHKGKEKSSATRACAISKS